MKAQLSMMTRPRGISLAAGFLNIVGIAGWELLPQLFLITATRLAMFLILMSLP